MLQSVRVTHGSARVPTSSPPAAYKPVRPVSAPAALVSNTNSGAVTRAVMETIASSAAAAVAYAVFANLLDACAAETAFVQAHGVSNAVGIRSPVPFALSAAVPQSGRRFHAEI